MENRDPVSPSVASREPDDGDGPEESTASDQPAPETPAEPDRGSGHGSHRVRSAGQDLQPRPRLLRRFVWAGVVLLGLVLLAAGWVGFRLWQANHHLTAAAALVQTVRDELVDGDTKAAADASHELQTTAGAARDAAHDPLWSLAEHLPLIGDNLTAVRQVTETVDSLSSHTLPPLIEVADTLDPKGLVPTNGGVPVDKLAAAFPRVIAADEAVGRAQATIAAIDRSHLIHAVARGVDELQAQLGAVRQDTLTAARAARVLPSMLGIDGPRSYLLVFQNLAELRATGGLFGAYAVVTADHGKIVLQEAGALTELIKRFDEPVLPLTQQQISLYTTRLGIYVGDTNLSPDFPTAARMTREMYRRVTGVRVDGVIATDPVALSYILKGTGPVKLGGGRTLTSANAVKFLLADAYRESANSAQSDALFAETARSVFTALSAGQGDSRAAFRGLVRAASERRVLVWSAEDKLETDLAGTVLGGTLPRDDSDIPTVGLFLNDGTGGKMDYYLSRQATLTQLGCRSDGRMDLSLQVTLATKAPASGLPDYVTGAAIGGKNVTRTIVMVFTPTGGTIEAVDQDGRSIVPGMGTEGGRSVAVFQVDLKPGGSSHLVVTMSSGRSSGLPESALRLRTTPMVTAGQTTIGPVTACRPT